MGVGARRGAPAVSASPGSDDGYARGMLAPPAALARRTRKPWRIVTWGCRAVALVFLAISCAWMVSDWAWEIDLVANMNAQWLLLALGALVVVCALRRWKAAAAVLLACALLAWPLMLDRAAWWPREAAADAKTPGLVRILHYNDSAASSKEEVYRLMAESRADVVHLLAPPVPMQMDVIYGRGLEDQYAGKLTREFRSTPGNVAMMVSAGFLAARWPLERVDVSSVGPAAEHFLAAVVRRPDAEGGPFALVAFHPRSPRTKERWVEGNGTVLAAIEIVRDLRARGLPVVAMTDLNATPSGYRSRELCGGAGLRRCKPVFAATGTYPDYVPMGLTRRTKSGLPGAWPLMLAIDDVLVTPEIGVESWRTLPFLRGQHTPMIVEISVARPAEATREANPMSR